MHSKYNFFDSTIRCMHHVMATSLTGKLANKNIIEAEQSQTGVNINHIQNNHITPIV